MIEINLVPDVKQQLISAQRVRNTVISIAIIAAIASVACVALLASYVFGVQTVRSLVADNSIKDNSKKLLAVKDINKTLTIQNQLSQISTLHDAKHMNSRVFEVLTSANLPDNDPNKVKYSSVSINTTDGTVTIDGQTPGFNGLDAYKKTIEATKLKYKADGESKTVNLASDVTVSSQSFGQSQEGGNVMTFTLTYTYAPELLAASSTDAQIVGPSRTNATDSYQGVPNSLFATRPNAEGGN